MYLVDVSGHAQSIQNNKLAISLQYLNKEGRDEVDILHVDKHQTFLLVDTINFGGHDHSCPKYLKYQFYKIFAVFQDWSGVLMKLCLGNNFSQRLTNDYFYLKNDGRDWGCSNNVLLLLLTLNISLLAGLCKY